MPHYVALTNNELDPWARMAADRQVGPADMIDVEGFSYLQIHDWDTIRQVLKDYRTFSNERGVIPRGPEPEGERVLEYADPPQHTIHRKLVAKAFTATQVDGKAERVQEIADDLIDAIGEQGERFELRHDFGRPLPSRIVAEILGIPPGDQEYFIGLIEQGEAQASVDLELTDEGAAVHHAYLDYIYEQFRIRETNPTNDLLSSILHAEIEGEMFTRLEAAAIVRLLLGAGNGTTSIAISNTVWLVESNQREKAKLLADLDRLAPLAVEEGLRFDCPVSGNFRGVASDAEVGGVALKEGDRVYCLYSSANHDPRRYDQPDAFIVDRDWDHLPSHYAFGHGIHYCIGASLARLETTIGLKTLYSRLPNLRVAPGFVPEQLPGMVFRTLTSLPMVYDGPVLARS